MKNAFKEWAVVVDALGQGKQILILRKGGISEGPGGFKMEHSRFLLVPTLFHQQRESVIPEAQLRFDQIAPTHSAPDAIHLEYFAEVIHSIQLKSLKDAHALVGQHIWTEDVIAKRFDWGGEKSIHAVAVRVYRLPQAVNIPTRPEYAGCKSWIELSENIDETKTVSVLSDADFNLQLARFKSALHA